MSGPYHHGELRPALLAAARARIDAEGPHGVSLRAVARDIGVSPAAPYHHFPDKDALIAAIAEDATREMNSHLLRRAENAPSPRARLTTLGIGYFEYAQAHPRLFALVHGPEAPESTASSAAREDQFQILYQALADCMPGAEDRDIRIGFATAWALVHGLAILARDQRIQALLPDMEPPDLARQVLDQLTVHPSAAESSHP